MSLDLNVTYVLVLVLFLIPLLFLNAILFRPFLKLFEERHERLEGALARAEGMLAKAEERAETFNEKIKVATARGIEKRNEIRASARTDMDERIAAEKAALDTRLAAALEEIAKKRRVAHADIIVEAEKIAELTATKLLGRSI